MPMIFFRGFFSRSEHLAFLAFDISLACFNISGMNLSARLIITPTRFSGIKGTGLKNHCTAPFTDDGFVVRDIIRPVSIIRKNLKTTRKPSCNPCFVMEMLKKEKRVPPCVVRARAAKTKHNRIRKYFKLFKVAKMSSPVFFRKTSRIIKYKRETGSFADNMEILIIQMIKSLHRASRLCRVEWPSIYVNGIILPTAGYQD